MRTLHALLLAGLLGLPFLAQAEFRNCLVVGVADGDTITARCGAAGSYEQVKVRFNGIDSPEKRQPFGERAKQAMSDLVYMKDVELDCFKTDRYGRSVCKVMGAPAPDRPKTLDVGLAMVSQGMAWWYRAYSREQTAEERTRYEAAEAQAKAQGAGLWRDAAPTPPWEWRAERRAHAQR
jgi:endonuclease YncB( thermonuclease family)